VHECDRFFLFRESAQIQTSFGELQVKKIIGPDHRVRFIPEYEAIKRTARENKLPLKDVYNRVLCDINTLDRK
jgi:uncharacterized protein (DUF111 family)